MRPDSLARLLTFGNIRAGSNVLVVESCSGLVVGACLERMGGVGNCVNLYLGKNESTNMVRLMNMTKAQKDILYNSSLMDIRRLVEPRDGDLPPDPPVDDYYETLSEEKKKAYMDKREAYLEVCL